MKRVFNTIFLALFLTAQVIPAFITPARAIAPLAAVPIALNVIAGSSVTAVGVSGATVSVGAFVKGFAVLTAAAAGLTWLVGGYDGAPSQAPSVSPPLVSSLTGVSSYELYRGYAVCGEFTNPYTYWKLIGVDHPSAYPNSVIGTNQACPSGGGTGNTEVRYRFIARYSDGTKSDFVYLNEQAGFDSGEFTAGYDQSLADSVIEFSHSPTGYSFNSDPDIPLSVGGDTGFPVLDDSGRLVLGSTNPDGQFVVNTVSSLPDGGSMISEYVQIAPNQVSSTQVQISPTGQISNVSTAQTSGTVNAVPTSVGVSYSPVTAPTPTNQGQFNPETGEIEFPADYARTGEAGAAASQVVNGLLQGDLITPAESTESMPWFGSTFDGLSPSLSVSSTCPIVSFGQTRFGSFDSSPFCEMLQPQQGFLFAIFTAVWTLLGFRVVMSA